MSALREHVSKVLAEAVPCRCSVDYTGRGLVAPDCAHHDAQDAVEDILAGLVQVGWRWRWAGDMAATGRWAGRWSFTISDPSSPYKDAEPVYAPVAAPDGEGH